MAEDFNVTGAGFFGSEFSSNSIREERVFINNADMIEFVRKYYSDEPNP